MEERHQTGPRFRRGRWPLLTAFALATLPALPPGDVETLNPVLSIALQSRFNAKSAWHVTAYQAPGAEGRYGDTPAKICFHRGITDHDRHCTALMKSATNEADRLVYQTVTALSVTRLLGAPSSVEAVIAHAEMSYDGSETAQQVALWAYNRATDEFQPLATFQVSDQGEVEFYDAGKLAGCAVTAEHLQGVSESAYGRHRFAISVHRFDPVTLTYTDLLHYVTAEKYPSLDEGGVDVVRHEVPQMLRILKYIYPATF